MEEAEKVVESGYGKRMMLELSPDKTFGVLSPAFKGCEENFALQIFADEGCTFLKDNLCELFGTGLQPLECRFCHHSRKGLGLKCHDDISLDWNNEKGRELIVKWSNKTKFKEKISLTYNQNLTL